MRSLVALLLLVLSSVAPASGAQTGGVPPVVRNAALPYLTLAAVTELKTKSDTLQAENDRLRAELASLRSEMRRLAAMIERR
jgi:hypothetical protein